MRVLSRLCTLQALTWQKKHTFVLQLAAIKLKSFDVSMLLAPVPAPVLPVLLPLLLPVAFEIPAILRPSIMTVLFVVNTFVVNA